MKAPLLHTKFQVISSNCVGDKKRKLERIIYDIESLLNRIRNLFQNIVYDQIHFYLSELNQTEEDYNDLKTHVTSLRHEILDKSLNRDRSIDNRHNNAIIK